MKIWEKYLFFKLAKSFSFFLFSLFFIYVIVDLSAHGVKIFAKSDLLETLRYYFYSFVNLLELFLTLSFLLASMRLLFNFVAAKEIIALLMAGISKKKLLRPFFIFAFFLSALCYINHQYFAPFAQDYTYAFKTTYKKKKTKEKKQYVHSLLLEDGSEIIYQSLEKGKLFDVFWIRSPQDIWHMKTLQIDHFQGEHVNHLVRNQEKQFEKSESFLQKDFPEISWSKEQLTDQLIPYESRSLSSLFFEAMQNSSVKTTVLSHLYYKIASPVIFFLLIFAISPICMKFTRTTPYFLIASIALFSLISLKVILDGMLILGENQVLPAFVAIFTPLLVTFFLSVPAFVKMK